MHPDLLPLAGLLGEWAGEGQGEYPTISPFGYHEVVTFAEVGKPFLAYAQRTRALDDGRPLHAETGYWRVGGGGAIEVVLSSPTGLVEVSTGSVEHDGAIVRCRLHTTLVGLTPTAKEVRAVERVLTLDGDRLHYTLAMAAVGHPLTHHLSATLHRVTA